MSERGGLLLVLPAGAGGGLPASAPVAGLPVLRRIVLAAERAGFTAVLVAGLAPADRALLAGTSAVPLSEQTLPAELPRRIVVVPANIVPQAAWLARLRERPVEPDRLHVNDGPIAVLEVEEPGRIVALVARAATAPEAMTLLAGTLKTARGALEADGHRLLRDARDLSAAESWLLRSLVKPSEGFMSRHFERRISLALTRRLVATPITPNAMTLVSLAVGLAGAALFLSPAWQLTAALLFLAHSILDGCDGELARLKFLESPQGAVLDFWGDNLVHAAVFTAMAVGWSLHAGAAWPLAVGAVAVASTAMVAVTVYRRGLLARAPADAGRSSRLLATLAHRDFIYLIVILAAAGKAYWFIAFTAVGAPVFLLLLLWSERPAPSP